MSASRKFWKSGALLLIASVGVNFSSLVFQSLLARWLTDDDFGALKWANDWIGYVLIPVAALQLVMVRHVAVLDAQANLKAVASLAWRALQRLIWYAAGFLLFVIVAHPWLIRHFKLSSPVLLWVAVGMAPVQLTTPVTISLLQGLQRFNQLAMVGLTSAWGRVLFGLGFVLLGWKATGALGGQVLGSACGTFLALWALRELWHYRLVDHRELDTRPVYRDFWPVFVVLYSINNIGLMDMSFVKYYFDQESSGQYAKAKLVAQAFGFLIMPLTTLLFPKAAWDATRGETGAIRVLWQALAGTALIGVGVATFCTLWPAVPIRVLAGPGNAMGESMVASFVWAMLPLSLAVLPMQFFLARAEFRRLLVPLVVLVVAYPVALWCWHQSLFQVLAVMAIAGSAVLIVLIRSLWHAR